MENAAWLDRLNRKMPLYQHCTFEELMGLGFFYFVVTTPIAGVVLKMTIDITIPAVVIGLVLSLVLTRLSTKLIGKVKDGKPDGYLSQHLRLWSAKLGAPSPYITRQGKWSIGRTKP